MTEVWAVHATYPAEIRPTSVIFSGEDAALSYAAELSGDPNVLAASVVKFVVDEPGNRRGVGMYVKGVRQAVPHISDDRTVHGGGRCSTGC